MAAPRTPYKYFAFLSYCHADSAVAKRLHRELERYQIPKPLVGRQSQTGTVPRNLFPIFLDRAELASSPDLSNAIRTALAESDNLILICSPSAAQSRWVNAEIVAFRALGRGQRIFPVIIEGEANSKNSAKECFPEALRLEQIPGELVEQFSGPNAADMRPQGDGKEDGKIKLVAGLLGIPLNELRRRELVEAQRRARVSQGIAAALLLLTAGAATGGWLAYQNQKKAERRLDTAIGIVSGVVEKAAAISDTYKVPRTAIGELLKYADSSFSELSREDYPDSLRIQQARILFVYADKYTFSGNSVEQLHLSETALDLLLPLKDKAPKGGDFEPVLADAYARIGTAQVANGNLTAALTAYRLQLSTLETVNKPDLSVADKLIAISAGQNNIAMVLGKQGNLGDALQTYKKSLSNLEQATREHSADKASVALRASVHTKVGETYQSLNDQEEALREYHAAHRIYVALNEGNPESTGIRRELAASFNSIGRTMLIRGDIVGAIGSHNAALNISSELTKSDATNLQWQLDLGMTKLWLGDAISAQKNNAVAASASAREYSEGCKILRELSTTNSWNAQYKFSVSSCLERTANWQLQHRLEKSAAELFREKLEISSSLAKMDPTNAEWQRDLFISNIGLAKALQATSRDEQSGKANLVRALEIADQLRKSGRLLPIDAELVASLRQRLQ